MLACHISADRSAVQKYIMDDLRCSRTGDFKSGCCGGGVFLLWVFFYLFIFFIFLFLFYSLVAYVGFELVVRGFCMKE